MREILTKTNREERKQCAGYERNKQREKKGNIVRVINVTERKGKKAQDTNVIFFCVVLTLEKYIGYSRSLLPRGMRTLR